MYLRPALLCLLLSIALQEQSAAREDQFEFEDIIQQEMSDIVIQFVTNREMKVTKLITQIVDKIENFYNDVNTALGWAELLGTKYLQSLLNKIEQVKTYKGDSHVKKKYLRCTHVALKHMIDEKIIVVTNSPLCFEGVMGSVKEIVSEMELRPGDLREMGDEILQAGIMCMVQNDVADEVNCIANIENIIRGKTVEIDEKLANATDEVNAIFTEKGLSASHCTAKIFADFEQQTKKILSDMVICTGDPASNNNEL